MKRLILLSMAVAVLSASSCNNDNNRGCKQFRNGNFIIKRRQGNEIITFLIQRKDSIQIETNKSTGDISKLSVKWTGECKYELSLLESTKVFPDSIEVLRKKSPIKIEIFNWTSDYYVFKAARANFYAIKIDTMWLQK